MGVENARTENAGLVHWKSWKGESIEAGMWQVSGAVLTRKPEIGIYRL